MRINTTDGTRLEILHATIAPMIILNFPKGSLKRLEAGTEVSRRLQDELSLIRFYSNTGYMHSVRGRHDLGMEFSEKAFDRAVQINDISAMAQTSPDLCLANISAGRFERVIDVAELMIHAIEKADRKTDHFGGPAIVYPSFFAISGYSKALLGDFSAGLADCHTGLAKATETKSLFTTSVCRLYTGYLHQARGDWEESSAVFAQCLEDMGNIKFTQIQASAKAGLGLALAYTGNPGKGGSLCREAGILFKDGGIKWDISNFFLAQGICAFISSDFFTAKDLVDLALKSAVKSRDTYSHARTLIWSGRLAAGTGRLNHARQQIREGLGILKALKVQPDLALAIFFMGELYLASDQPEKAGNQFKTAEKMFSGMGMVYWQKQAWAASGKL